MKNVTWSLQNQASKKMYYIPTDYTDIARIGFAPKIVKNLTKNSRIFFRNKNTALCAYKKI